MAEDKKKVAIGAGVIAAILALLLFWKRAEAMPCEEGTTKCVNSDLYECQQGEWVLVEENALECDYVPITDAKILEATWTPSVVYVGDRVTHFVKIKNTGQTTETFCTYVPGRHWIVTLEPGEEASLTAFGMIHSSAGAVGKHEYNIRLWRTEVISCAPYFPFEYDGQGYLCPSSGELRVVTELLDEATIEYLSVDAETFRGCKVLDFDVEPYIGPAGQKWMVANVTVNNITDISATLTIRADIKFRFSTNYHFEPGEVATVPVVLNTGRTGETLRGSCYLTIHRHQYQVIKEIPESRLTKTVTLPLG